MNRFFHSAVALARGAALAGLLAGLADALSLSLGGGADRRALALGAILLALAVGLLHEGAGQPPLQASYRWLVLGAALPMFSGLAPVTAIGGLLFLLPLRALGARLSGMLALEPDPALAVFLHLCGAGLGMVWLAGHGLGLAGFLVAFVVAGLLTTRLPAPALEGNEEEFTPRQRGITRLGRMAIGAGLTWLFLLLMPLVRAFDASGAAQDSIALLSCLLLVAAGWCTLGSIAAQSPHRAVWAALAAGAAAVLLPVTVSAIDRLARPLTFEAWMSAGVLRALADTGGPRLPEEHWLYLPWLVLGTIALPLILCGITVRSALGRLPCGPDALAPLLLGAGAALVAFSLPLAAAGAVPWLGWAAIAALLIAAAAELLGPPGLLWLRLTAGAGIAVAAFLLARPAPPPALAFPLQDLPPWELAKDQAGAALSVSGRDALWRIVERESGPSEQFLARGRNLLTPALDAPGLWTRDVDLALLCAPGARRALLAGAAQPASLRALARAGVTSALLAQDPAMAALLERRDPAGYGLQLEHAASLARAGGRFDLVLLRTQGLWDEDVSLARPWVATQARHHLRPGGACVLALDPAQLVPGLLPSLAAVWRRVFAAVDLLVEPDGLRGVRLLLVGRMEAGELAAELQPLAVPQDWLQRIADAGSISSLMAPLPRSHGKLSETTWRLTDELRAVRRAQAVLEELSNLAGANPPPCLLAFAAPQYAAQEYSAHDNFRLAGPESVEVAEPALAELLRLARAWPKSAWLRATWADVGATLAAKREVEMVETYLTPLREELGWREAGIGLPLARAALEVLDEDGARALIDEALAAEPGNAEALHLQRILEGKDSLAPDAHQGHEHN